MCPGSDGTTGRDSTRRRSHRRNPGPDPTRGVALYHPTGSGTHGCRLSRSNHRHHTGPRYRRTSGAREQIWPFSSNGTAAATILDRLIAARPGDPDALRSDYGRTNGSRFGRGPATRGLVPVHWILRLTERTTLTNGRGLFSPESPREDWDITSPRVSTPRPSSPCTPTTPRISDSLLRSRPAWTGTAAFRDIHHQQPYPHPEGP